MCIVCDVWIRQSKVSSAFLMAVDCDAGGACRLLSYRGRVNFVLGPLEPGRSSGEIGQDLLRPPAPSSRLRHLLLSLFRWISSILHKVSTYKRTAKPSLQQALSIVDILVFVFHNYMFPSRFFKPLLFLKRPGTSLPCLAHKHRPFFAAD